MAQPLPQVQHPTVSPSPISGLLEDTPTKQPTPQPQQGYDPNRLLSDGLPADYARPNLPSEWLQPEANEAPKPKEPIRGLLE